MSDALDVLLERLTKGELDAAEEVYLTFKPVLRVMVRRRLTPRLRAKFDSMDVVQSAWSDILRGFRDEGWHFSDRQHLRAYLARVTYNHFVSLCRQHGPMMQHEQPFVGDEQTGLPHSAQPRPSELAQAEELWEQLVGLCPPAHHELLRLKRQGLRLAEIANRTGMHPSSVRRILYGLARRLAAARGEMSSASPSLPTTPA
jgi:RNA polymerase sigma-70 factor (ECF subfamily)